MNVRADRVDDDDDDDAEVGCVDDDDDDAAFDCVDDAAVCKADEAAAGCVDERRIRNTYRPECSRTITTSTTKTVITVSEREMKS